MDKIVYIRIKSYIGNIAKIIECEKRDKLTYTLIRLETYIGNIFDGNTESSLKMM